MSTPSPEAKQFGRDVCAEIKPAYYAGWSPNQLSDWIAMRYDTAIAKLREGLEQEKLDFEKEVSDHYAELHREFKRQLAHQQPSATTPCCERDHDTDGNCDRHPATTPDVEKIRTEISEMTDVDETALKLSSLFAQVREPLVGLLRRARRNVEHSASHPAGAASRELLAEIDVALAGTEEKI